MLADQIPVSGIVRMDCDANVAEDRLRPGGRHRDPLVGAFDDGVTHVGELALDFLVIHLEVRQHRLAVFAPVGDAVASIDQAFFEQPHEGGAHRADVVRFHGEQVARPIGRRAQFA